jgi:ribonuclease HII
VAACVVISPDFDPAALRVGRIKDSKRISERMRDDLAGVIPEIFSAVGIGVADHEEIDEINILQASFSAMKRAVSDLAKDPDFVIVDGNREIPGLGIKQQAIIGADASVLAVSAASIIAKAARDKMMRAWHEEFPQYGFDRHKGYGTRAHLEALAEFGPCPLHRRSFAPVSRFFASERP